MAARKTGNILIYDSTLRDGAQGELISFSAADKIRIAQKLDNLGVSFIEGGWPSSNPLDNDFFREIKSYTFRYAKLCACGCTRRKHTPVEEDEFIWALLDSDAPVCTVVGKASLLHVTDVLQTTPEENLSMIRDSISFLKSQGREVHFDAEHFFDAWKYNREYTEEVLKAAVESGASCITLCDTNGGMLPIDIMEITGLASQLLPEDCMLGIHCHNDSGVAVANSIVAIRAGAAIVQGTFNGIGERCGNADLTTLIPDIELKMNLRCLPEGHLVLLKSVSDFIYEKCNMPPDIHAPYVGNSAFAHKAGMHVDAIAKNPCTFEHISPERVGNRQRILISDLSGQQNLSMKATELGFDLRESMLNKLALEELKRRESAGYEYESAEASFVALMHRVVNLWPCYFTLEGYRVIVEKRRNDDSVISEATVKLSVGGVSCLTAAEGDGPVNALDIALRKSLETFYPELKDVSLIDYRVRILESVNGTAAQTRVRIQSRDSVGIWDTVGVSENIIDASRIALVDSVEYALFKKHIKPIDGKKIDL